MLAFGCGASGQDVASDRLKTVRGTGHGVDLHEQFKMAERTRRLDAAFLQSGGEPRKIGDELSSGLRAFTAGPGK